MVTERTFDQLVKVALLGTERDGAAPANGRDAETQLLDEAALAIVMRRAGRLPDDATTAKHELCAPEDQKRIGARAIAHGMTFLYEPKHRDLLVEWLDGVAAVDKVVPPRLLAPLLEAGRHHPKIADRVRGVIGERGRWLARHNESWRYALDGAVAVDPSAFVDATSEERIRMLGGWRATDPAAAREALVAAWSDEKARARTELVEAMRTNLSTDDEPFLESCLDDRSKEVRRAAARLLARLPASKLADRMAQRALTFVTPSPSGWDVTLPTEIDDAMLRDGIMKTDSSADGYHWCLTQIVQATPPAAYEGQGSPEALVGGLLKSAQRSLLGPAIAKAAQAYDAHEWIEALIFEKVEDDGALWTSLPAARREALFLRVLERATSHVSLHRALFHLPKVDGPWGSDLSKRVLDAMQKLTSSEERLGEFPAFAVLRDAGRKLATSTFPAVKKLVDHTSERSYWKKSLTDCLELLERRAALRAALQED